MNSEEKSSDKDAGGTKQDSRHMLDWYRACVDLFKSAVWPLAVLFVFLSIKTPLLSFLDELPGVIQSTQKVTIGTVSIERKLKDAGIPVDVRKALAGLSRDGLILLLDTGKNGFRYLAADWEATNLNASAIRELEKNGLLILAKSSPDAEYPITGSLTPAAKNAYEIILMSLTAQLAEDTGSGGIR